MTPRRTFLKGIFATVAIVATGKLVAASEMLGNYLPTTVAPRLTGIDMMLTEESGRIADMIASKILSGSPWTALIKTQPWPENLGETLQYIRPTVS